jgi:DNA repair protein RadC
MGSHDGHRERMRQRFIRFGLDNFEDHNVLELLLFYAQPRKDTNELAHRLMDTFGTLDKVFEASYESLMAVPGMGESGAVLIRLVPALARRYLQAKQGPRLILAGSAQSGAYLIPIFLGATEEMLYMLCLDAKMELLDCIRLGDGSASAVRVNIRTIVQTALEKRAEAVILAHNHVSGIAVPSQEDKVVTRQVQEALSTVGIYLLDHIVVADGDFVSMYDSGLMS